MKPWERRKAVERIIRHSVRCKVAQERGSPCDCGHSDLVDRIMMVFQSETLPVGPKMSPAVSGPTVDNIDQLVELAGSNMQGLSNE